MDVYLNAAFIKGNMVLVTKSSMCIKCVLLLLNCHVRDCSLCCVSLHYSKEGPALVTYEFDASLVKMPTVTVAPAGHIAINNLTATPLKEK